MEDLSKYTPTELLKMVNDSKARHDFLKKEIIECTTEVDSLVIRINKNLEILTEMEKNYIELIEELNNRDGV